MTTLQTIREALERHVIAPDPPGYDWFQPRLTQKCSGCPWIGWDHRLHVAKVIEKAIQPLRQQ